MLGRVALIPPPPTLSPFSVFAGVRHSHLTLAWVQPSLGCLGDGRLQVECVCACHRAAASDWAHVTYRGREKMAPETAGWGWVWFVALLSSFHSSSLLHFVAFLCLVRVMRTPAQVSTLPKGDANAVRFNAANCDRPIIACLGENAFFEAVVRGSVSFAKWFSEAERSRSDSRVQRKQLGKRSVMKGRKCSVLRVFQKRWECSTQEVVLCYNLWTRKVNWECTSRAQCLPREIWQRAGLVLGSQSAARRWKIKWPDLRTRN